MFDFDEEPDRNNPLDLIVKNKDLVRHLRTNGIDGMEITRIFSNRQGLKKEFSVFQTEGAKIKQRKVIYAMRHVSALINNDVIMGRDHENLCEIYEGLKRQYQPWEKDAKGQLVISYRMGEGEAKTHKQMIGRQVVALYTYLQKHNTNKEMFLQKSVFLLIAELFFVGEDLKFTRKQIENFYKNNLR